MRSRTQGTRKRVNRDFLELKLIKVTFLLKPSGKISVKGTHFHYNERVRLSLKAAPAC
ncbi:MAG: hypothetical protein M1508_03100 [Nitrospirae bacterium]|nr:hypothetical protein [Nitrospirota bacterium]